MSDAENRTVGKELLKPWVAPTAMDDNDVYPSGSMQRRVIFDPPPRDARCEVCGRQVADLPAYGGPGDPLVGDFRGAKLVRTFKCDWEVTNEEVEEFSKRIREDEPGLSEEVYESAVSYFRNGPLPVEAIWLCRDCFVLDRKTQIEKYDSRPDVIEERRARKAIDDTIEKEATALLFNAPRPHQTVGDMDRERWLPIEPSAHHYEDVERYSYYLERSLDIEQTRPLQKAGWELVYVEADTSFWTGRPTGRLRLVFRRARDTAMQPTAADEAKDGQTRNG